MVHSYHHCNPSAGNMVSAREVFVIANGEEMVMKICTPFRNSKLEIHPQTMIDRMTFRESRSGQRTMGRVPEDS